MLMIFFRDGPISYAGVLPTWIPLGEFFAWMVVLTVFGFRAIAHQEALCREESEPGFGLYAPMWDDPIAAFDADERLDDRGNGRVAEPVRPRVPVGR
jgi:hypothetical protein